MKDRAPIGYFATLIAAVGQSNVVGTDAAPPYLKRKKAGRRAEKVKGRLPTVAYPEVSLASEDGRVWRYHGRRAQALALLASGRGITQRDMLPHDTTPRKTIHQLRQDGLEIETVLEGRLGLARYWLRTAGTLIEEEPLTQQKAVPPLAWELPIRGGLLRGIEVEYRGVLYFDLRVWVAEGAKPTSKGFRMPRQAVRSLARTLTAYSDTLGSSEPENGN